MKKMFSGFGLLVLAAVLSLSVISCGDPEPDTDPEECAHHGSEATIKITGLQDYNGDMLAIILGTGNSVDFFGGNLISNDLLETDIFCWECREPDFKAGTYKIRIVIYDFNDTDIDYYFGVIESSRGSVNFGVAESDAGSVNVGTAGSGAGSVNLGIAGSGAGSVNLGISDSGQGNANAGVTDLGYSVN